VGQEIRDRFTGAVEAFARRNSGSGRQGDHSRHKSLADSFGTSNEAVSLAFSCGSKYTQLKFNHMIHEVFLVGHPGCRF
jgi:hypothetical protein